METITKMAGHSSMKITESAYAKVLDEKISNDMKKIGTACAMNQILFVRNLNVD